jgi:hypothetical protein
MKRVKFLVNIKLPGASRLGETPAGTEWELDPLVADHYISRGMAEEVPIAEKAPEKKKKATKSELDE